MKFSLSWLNEHVDLSGRSPEELAETLVRLGFEVESIEKGGPSFTGVVTAQVKECARHPDADKLSVCKVFDGTDTFDVVCGAPNVAAGQKVALARVGARLDGGNFKIKKSKIRGALSEGMICSASELGLESGKSEGILELPADTKLGLDAGELLTGGGDVVLDVSITPDRPDCLSHFGLAREIAAVLGLKKPVLGGLEPLKTLGETVPIKIEDPEACPRYIGRVMRGVRVGPSPDWLQKKLKSLGVAAINNIVDITNYVLHDMGHPLHAFDLKKLDGPAIVVRRARKGEFCTGLDKKDHKLDPADLVIADAKRPVAIAGVLGGLETAVDEYTTEILLESAYFHPGTVRKTARRHALATDSSYRFERGADCAAAALAAAKAARLISELCGQGVESAAPRDVYPTPVEPPKFQADHAKIASLSGLAPTRAQVEKTLQAIAQNLEEAPGGWEFQAPSHRMDLATNADLAEEVARFEGYDKIPSATQRVALAPIPEPEDLAWRRAARQRLVSLGLYEAMNYDIVSREACLKAGLPEDVVAAQPELMNPLSEDWQILRPSLLPGLLTNLRHNLNRGVEDVRLFEIGKAYYPDASSDTGVKETWLAAGILAGRHPAGAFWKSGAQTDIDFFTLKGLSEAFWHGRRGVQFAPYEHPALHPKLALEARRGKDGFGAFGAVHPSILEAFDIDGEAWYFEFDVAAWGKAGGGLAKLAAFSTYPAARRDLALLLDDETPYAEVQKTALKGGGKLLAGVDLIDVYAGKGIPEGKKSFAIRLTLSSMDGTLKDAEIQATVEAVLNALQSKVGAQLRG